LAVSNYVIVVVVACEQFRDNDNVVYFSYYYSRNISNPTTTTSTETETETQAKNSTSKSNFLSLKSVRRK